jgi:putative nucleotidyltransferase with HDIG domain
MDSAQAKEKLSRGNVAIVDDDEAMLTSLKRILGFYGFSIKEFISGNSALEAFKASPEAFDVVLTDLNMPGIDGIELLRQIKEFDEGSVVIVLTGFPSADNAISALRGGAFDFLEKPYSNEVLSLTLDKGIELRRLRRSMASHQKTIETALDERSRELRKTISKLNEAYFNTLQVIVSLLELKEPNTAEHSKRVSSSCAALASASGMPEGPEKEALRCGAMLHDIGKIALPDEVLKKGDALSDEETELFKKHPKTGFEIVSTIPDMEMAARIVSQHHERYDGKGFPDGLAGDQILKGARILAVVNAYDKLRNGEKPGQGVSKEAALASIESLSGTEFDPACVALLKANSDALNSL